MEWPLASFGVYLDPKTDDPFEVDDSIRSVAKTIFAKYSLESWSDYKARHALIVKNIVVAEKGNPIARSSRRCSAPSSFADVKKDNCWVDLLKKDIEGKPTFKRLDDETIRPRITILCKEFFEFSRSIESVKLDQKDCLFARKICSLMGSAYLFEKDRLEDFRYEFRMYSGHQLQCMGLSNQFMTAGSMRHNTDPLYCNLEGKLERGKGSSDPYMQNIAYYWKSFEDRNMENLQYPCLSLELEGYHFNVSGMVNTEKEIVAAPFMNSHVSLLKRPEEDELYKIARTFKSVKLYLDSMKSKSKRPFASSFPFVKSFRNNLGQLENLKYIEELNRKVFIATRNNSDAKVVVKFTSKYNVEIHRFFHKKGVSPELLCCEKMDDDFL